MWVKAACAEKPWRESALPAKALSGGRGGGVKAAEIHPVVDLRDLRLRQMLVAPGNALPYLAGYRGRNQLTPAIIPGKDFLVCRWQFLFGQGVDRMHAAGEPCGAGLPAWRKRPCIDCCGQRLAAHP